MSVYLPRSFSIGVYGGWLGPNRKWYKSSVVSSDRTTLQKSPIPPAPVGLTDRQWLFMNDHCRLVYKRADLALVLRQTASVEILWEIPRDFLGNTDNARTITAINEYITEQYGAGRYWFSARIFDIDSTNGMQSKGINLKRMISFKHFHIALLREQS